MADLQNIYNLVKCGADSVLGTGTKGCKQSLKKASSIWLTPKGFKFDGSETLDEDYIQSLQVEGSLIVLKGLRTFTDNSSEDIIESLEDGTKQVATLGLYEFAVQFINGLAFHAALHSLNSYGSYDVIFVDRDGNLFGTTAIDGSFKGFSVGMLQANKLAWASDSTGQKEGIMFQLTDRAELDINYIYIQQSQLSGFYPQNQDGINEVVLKFDAIPADAGTEIVVSAKSKSNMNAWIGADEIDFKITNDGTVLTKTVSELNGVYSFTVEELASNNKVIVSLDGIIDKDGSLYKADKIEAIVI